MRYLAILTLASCATFNPPSEEQKTGCYTYCGLFADRLPPGWTCNDLQAVENATASYTLRFSTDVPAMSGARSCNLHYWTLMVVNEESWFHPRVGNILGLTSCDDKQIFINNMPWGKNSLAHEYIHAFQNCKPEGEDKDDPAHSMWKENGLYSVINAVRSLR